MNSWVSFIYDAAAVAIILICMARGAKDGFAKAFVQTVGLVVSVAAALYVSRVCASLIYTTAIQPGLLSTIESSIENAVDTESVVGGLKAPSEQFRRFPRCCLISAAWRQALTVR